MLKNAVEDYLSSVGEGQFYLPFKHLLESKGYNDVHVVHGPTEFGKDIIAKKTTDDGIQQYFFPVKAGDIDQGKYRNEVLPQVLQAVTHGLSHPNFDKGRPHKVVFVTTGKMNSSVALAFQEFNNTTVVGQLRAPACETIEADDLVPDFVNLGLEPFFSKSTPDDIASFYRMYARIVNDESVNWFEVERCTRFWLDRDWQNPTQRLGIVFEAFFFSTLLKKRGRYYEACLFLAALARNLMKNRAPETCLSELLECVDQVLEDFWRGSTAFRQKNGNLVRASLSPFGIFDYPRTCLKTTELLALRILISPIPNTGIIDYFLKVIKEEKGCTRPISDSYAISIGLNCLALMKCGAKDCLRKYIGNTTIWLCDRYEELGIAPLGSPRKVEYLHLLSERLDGFPIERRRASFVAAILLDLAYLAEEPGLYEDVANDLHACQVLPEFYHILDDESLFGYGGRKITHSHDPDFSLESVLDYSSAISHERTNCRISLRGKGLFLLSFLLRDRYFPTFVKELL